MNPFTSPNRNRIGGAIHTREALRDNRNAALRAMDKWCEVLIPNTAEDSGGFGEPSTPDLKTARVRCSVSQLVQNSETPEGSVLDYEICLPRTVRLPAEARIAVPAFFEHWKPGFAYERGAMVIPRSIISGAGDVFKCVRAGVAGADEPKWTTKRASMVEDGLALWRAAGTVTIYEVISSAISASQPVQLIARCREIN